MCTHGFIAPSVRLLMPSETYIQRAYISLYQKEINIHALKLLNAIVYNYVKLIKFP